MSDYVMFNFITGQNERSPERYPNEPTPEYAEGWMACMHYGEPETANPYTPHTLEHHEWEDGWNAANED